jgi:hypothetical protein
MVNALNDAKAEQKRALKVMLAIHKSDNNGMEKLIATKNYHNAVKKVLDIADKMTLNRLYE